MRLSIRPRLRLLGPLILALVPLCGCGHPARSTSRPNLLLVTVDTLRADRVGFYSDRHVQTPNIDGLAGRGVVFTRAFSHCTTTLPAHTDIFLGATPLYHGVHDNANFVVGEEFLTLAEHLKGSGYSTAAFIGGFPLESRFGLDQGFDTYDDRLDRTGATPGDSWTRRAEAVIASALAWLEGRKSPWFVWVHLWDPHEPYSPPEPYKTRFADHPYDGEVAYVDAALGELFGYLDRTGLDRSSLVLLAGDHGESLGEHGETTHGFLASNATLWIPLIIARPGLAHRVVDAPVSHMDIFPTVCELLGIETPLQVQGTSLAGAMKGAPARTRPIYFESLTPFYSMGWAPVTGFIEGDEKFIDSPVPEIYDLGKDSAEAANIAGPATVETKRKELGALISSLSSGSAKNAARGSDRETVDRLRSLGYAAASPGGGRSDRTTFGPEDDVKALLPFYNRAMAALSLYEAGKAGEAIEEAKAVIGARKNISTAYLNLAHFYKEEGRPAEAAAVLKRGLEALPENYYIFLEYVTCLYEIGEFDAAIGVFEGRRPAQVEFDPLVWNYAGLSWLKKGDGAKARGCFEKALAIDGDSSISWYNLGDLDYFLFQSAGDRSRLEPAAGSLRKAAALDPTNGPARYVLGATLYQLGDYPGAIANLEGALALDPGIPEALYYLGLSHLRAGDTPKACARLREYRETAHFGALSAAEKEAVDGLISRFCKRDRAS
jgi:arylsulfatase A-like enzyme/tetratricopeptide (TPR) repeat protein